MSRVPLVDLSGSFEPGSRRDEAVDAIGRACEDVGFLVITGHGVDDGVAQRIDDASRRFLALPHDEKLGYADPVLRRASGSPRADSPKELLARE